MFTRYCGGPREVTLESSAIEGEGDEDTLNRSGLLNSYHRQQQQDYDEYRKYYPNHFHND